MDNEQEWARLLGALAQGSDEQGNDEQGNDEQGLAQRYELVRRGLDLGCAVGTHSAGCSVTEALAGGFHTPANSNGLALELDLVQYAADDGPCVAACRDGRSHHIQVMASQQDHPVFTEAALQLRVRSSLSLPLLQARRPTALNLYATHESAFEDPRTRAQAELLARVLGRLLADVDVPERLPSGPSFDDAMVRRRLMQRAVESVGSTSSLDRGAAFEVLATRSRTEGRSIFAVARDVMAGVTDA